MKARSYPRQLRILALSFDMWMSWEEQLHPISPSLAWFFWFFGERFESLKQLVALGHMGWLFKKKRFAVALDELWFVVTSNFSLSLYMYILFPPLTISSPVVCAGTFTWNLHLCYILSFMSHGCHQLVQFLFLSVFWWRLCKSCRVPIRGVPPLLKCDCAMSNVV